MSASASASHLKWRPTVRLRAATGRLCGAGQKAAPYPAPYPHLAQGVPQVSNLLYRRFPNRQTVQELNAPACGAASGFGNPRYRRLGSLRYKIAASSGPQPLKTIDADKVQPTPASCGSGGPPAWPRAPSPKPRAFFSYPKSVQESFGGFSPAPVKVSQTQSNHFMVSPAGSRPVKLGPVPGTPDPRPKTQDPKRGSNPVKPLYGQSSRVKVSQAWSCRPASRTRDQKPKTRKEGQTRSRSVKPSQASQVRAVTATRWQAARLPSPDHDIRHQG